MGTRNLTMVINKQGELKVAQYGQWDGYPSGQGATILRFCSNRKNLKALQSILPQIKFFNKCKDIDRWIEGYDKRCTEEFSNSIAEESKKKRTDADIYWFENLITRDLGGSILYSLISIDLKRLPLEHSNTIYLKDESDFGKDSLMCEWAYCINFKTNKLEVYEGFNQDRSLEGDLFKTTDKYLEEHYKDMPFSYYGIKKIKEYNLNKLPKIEKFVKELEPEET